MSEPYIEFPSIFREDILSEYNSRIKDSDIKENYNICLKCDGRRIIRESKLVVTMFNECDKCEGKGQVLWIDNILNKSKKFNIIPSKLAILIIKKNIYILANLMNNICNSLGFEVSIIVHNQNIKNE